MDIKNPFIILLGRPGCGKSAIYKILIRQFKEKGIADEFERIDDFPILKELLDKDTEFKRHIRKDGGFAVTDWSIVDEVLQVIDKRAFERAKDNKILFIEFARADYKSALKNFSEDFVKNSVILYIKVDFDVCLKRNEERFKEAGDKDIDSHIVPPDLMKSYYKDDDIEKLIETEGEEAAKREIPLNMYILDNNEKGIDILENKLDKFVEYYMLHLKRVKKGNGEKR